MNKRCEYKDGLGYRCGSYAFNLYKEKIEQGDRCDRHYWQDQAMKAAAHERDAGVGIGKRDADVGFSERGC